MSEILIGWFYKPLWAITTMEIITIICELSIIFGLLYIMRCMLKVIIYNKKKEERRKYKYFNKARKEGRKRNE